MLLFAIPVARITFAVQLPTVDVLSQLAGVVLVAIVGLTRQAYGAIWLRVGYVPWRHAGV